MSRHERLENLRERHGGKAPVLAWDMTGRDLLLQMEVLDHNNSQEGGELEVWLVSVEDKVETFRANYRTLTGVDVGAVGVKLES